MPSVVFEQQSNVEKPGLAPGFLLRTYERYFNPSHAVILSEAKDDGFLVCYRAPTVSRTAISSKVMFSADEPLRSFQSRNMRP